MNGKIILGEDEKHIGMMIKFKLQKLGLDVQWFETGPAILEAVLAAPPDLLLLDLMLPGMNGFDILANLRKNDATMQTPVVLLSAKSQKTDIEKGMALGATEYMMKPFDMNDLVDLVNRYVAGGDGGK